MLGTAFIEFGFQVLLPALASSFDGACSCTELYDINTNIYDIMSDSRRSPTTTPRSGGEPDTLRFSATPNSQKGVRTCHLLGQ